MINTARLITAEAYLEALYEIVAEYLDSPCGYGMSVRGYMLKNVGDWCEKHCGQVPDSACWRKFFELKIAERTAAKAMKKCTICGAETANPWPICESCSKDIVVTKAGQEGGND
jgi:hypothetical protein